MYLYYFDNYFIYFILLIEIQVFMIFLYVLLFFTLFNKTGYCYRIPEEEVRKIETIDDEICKSRGHSYEDEYTRELYWTCRLQLVNERIDNYKYKTKGGNKFYVVELKRIRQVIKNTTAKIRSFIEDRISGEEMNDRQIVLRGDEAYYYNLLSFLHYEYVPNNINSSREIKSIIAFRQIQNKQDKKQSINQYLKKYPKCIKYDTKSKEFDECIANNVKIDKCAESIEEKLKSREVEVKFNCKQKAYQDYPDYMALYNSEFEELQNMKVDEYIADKEASDKRAKRMAELNKLMTGPRLSKNQLINLRNYAERKCLIDSEIEANFYRLSLSNECEKLLAEQNEQTEVKE